MRSQPLGPEPANTANSVRACAWIGPAENGTKALYDFQQLFELQRLRQYSDRVKWRARFDGRDDADWDLCEVSVLEEERHQLPSRDAGHHEIQKDKARVVAT